jgi:hypothetical protein
MRCSQVKLNWNFSEIGSRHLKRKPSVSCCFRKFCEPTKSRVQCVETSPHPTLTPSVLVTATHCCMTTICLIQSKRRHVWGWSILQWRSLSSGVWRYKYGRMYWRFERISSIISQGRGLSQEDRVQRNCGQAHEPWKKQLEYVSVSTNRVPPNGTCRSGIDTGLLTGQLNLKTELQQELRLQPEGSVTP